MTSLAPIPFQNLGIYIVLSRISRPSEWHRAVYIGISNPWAQVYHATDKGRDDGDFFYEDFIDETLPYSTHVLLAVRIGSLRDEDELALAHSLLTAISTPWEGERWEKWARPWTCKTWVKEAVQVLLDNGLVALRCTPQELEDELSARVKGVQNGGLSQVMVDASRIVV